MMIDFLVAFNLLFEFGDGVVNLEERGTVFREDLGALRKQLVNMLFIFFL